MIFQRWRRHGDGLRLFYEQGGFLLQEAKRRWNLLRTEFAFVSADKLATFSIFLVSEFQYFRLQIADEVYFATT